MRIAEVHPQPDWVLCIVADDGRIGHFDVSPYLKYEAFEELVSYSEFMKVANGRYFVEWDCGADLSADCFWQMKPGPLGNEKQGQQGHPVFSLAIKIRAVWQ